MGAGRGQEKLPGGVSYRTHSLSQPQRLLKSRFTNKFDSKKGNFPIKNWKKNALYTNNCVAIFSVYKYNFTTTKCISSRSDECGVPK